MTADDIPIIVRSLHPSMYSMVRPSHLVICGERFVAAVPDVLIARRIADLLTRHGLEDLDALPVTTSAEGEP